MLSEIGRKELRNLLTSPLVDDWDAAEQTIRRVLRLLARQRPDLLRRYFDPTFFDRIANQPERTRLNAMAAVLRTAIVDLAGRPAVTHLAQARFYLRCFQDDLADAVRVWRYESASPPPKAIGQVPAGHHPETVGPFLSEDPDGPVHEPSGFDPTSTTGKNRSPT